MMGGQQEDAICHPFDPKPPSQPRSLDHHAQSRRGPRISGPRDYDGLPKCDGKEVDMAPRSIVNKTIMINAPTSIVWQTLTNGELIQEWFSETKASITSDWKLGSPIIFAGTLHGIEYRDKGTILQFDREKVLQYSHWSSLSTLSDSPENHSLIGFWLTAETNHTMLRLRHSNLLTEAMHGHANFYWLTALDRIKKIAERQSALED